MDCKNDSKKGQQWVTGVGLGGHDIESYRGLADKLVRHNSEGNNRRVCSRDTDVQNFNRCREGVGFQ